MIDLKELYLWCVVMLPLLLSPGPATIAVANVSATQGFRASVKFALSISLVTCVMLTFLGSFLGVVYAKYRSVFQLLELAGAIFIIYLGIKILKNKPKSGQSAAKNLKVKDALLLQALNAKAYPTLTMMFTQFMPGTHATGERALVLSGLVLFVSFGSYMLWSGLGVTLNRMKGAELIQRYGFGALLALVGVWMVFNGSATLIQ